ncbi:hypothetical protein MMC07_000779 [Pseudocyphellaria aurata]|nr:hypothetical protein [Pseudocyphellaria aurata]
MKISTCFHAIPRHWRTPKVLIGLFVVEFLITIPALALYGIASPDLYRTKLWKEGSVHGWNSNPNQILYAYANYRPIHYPLPWSSFPTKFNVIIAVLSVFLLLIKGIMFITHVFDPIVSAILHAVLVALYAISLHAQAGSDMSDPKHPQPGAPWYITKSCGAPVNPNVKGYCQQAKGAFAITILLITLFFAYFVVSLISLYPTAAHRASHSSRIPDSESLADSRPWEMTEAPRTPGTTGGLKSPTTPRTMAFNTLSQNGKIPKNGKAPARNADAQVPLRHHISMGDEVYSGPNGR